MSSAIPSYQHSYKRSASLRQVSSLASATALLGFLLSGVPRLHLSVGAPIYAVDILIFYLLIKALRQGRVQFSGYASSITKVLFCYAAFVILGEIHGGVLYNRPFDSLYILIRVTLAISIAYIIPTLVCNVQALRIVVKGVCLGLLLSAVISLLYSFPITRGLSDIVFSIKAIAPDSDRIVGMANSVYDSNFSGNYRGRNLLGASTFSSGVMATLWPLLFVGRNLSLPERNWKILYRIALLLVPLGILTTYGRSAWISVVLVSSSIFLWGSLRSRIKIIFLSFIAIFVIAQVGAETLSANLPLINRIVSKTQIAIEEGAANESEAERFLAYIEPFSHVSRYPSFLVAGSGAAQRRWGGNIYEEGSTASHAVPAMAYYAYGVGGALCQISLVVMAFRMILSRLRQAQQHLPEMIWIWRSLLACWCGLLPWWCFGHGIITAPRGAMVFFFLIGVMLACDRIFNIAAAQNLVSKSIFRRELP